MERVTLSDFVSAPIGKWTQVPTVLAWVASPRLCGLSYSGFVVDVDRLRELAALPLHAALSRPYRAILDCADVTEFDPPALAFVVEHVRDLAQHMPLFERVVCVWPAGMMRAMALGMFHEHVSAHLDATFVDDFASALDHVEAGVHRAPLLAMYEEARGAGMVAALRATLRAEPTLSLATVAARLGVSTRSLQRACASAGSAFRDEVAEARFAFADALLRSTHDKIETIARSAGYASATSFSRRFHQTYGQTPAELRRQRTK